MVGVNTVNAYSAQSGQVPLEYADSDAERLADALDERGYKTAALTNALATKDAIMKKVWHEVLQSTPEDTFVFFFAGHGFSDALGERYLLVHEDGKPGITLVSVTELDNIFRQHRGAVYAVFDACFDSYDITIPRGSSPRSESTTPGQVSYLFASTAKERAIESRKLGAGLLTHALLEALDTANQRTAFEEPVNLMEAFEVASIKTTELAASLYGVQQTPVTTSRLDVTNSPATQNLFMTSLHDKHPKQHGSPTMQSRGPLATIQINSVKRPLSRLYDLGTSSRSDEQNSGHDGRDFVMRSALQRMTP